jgi:hypothetical protein
VNPLDKSTIVSIFPKEIYETKHTITPGTFHLIPGTFDNPSLLVIGPSSWWKEIDESQPPLEIPVSSVIVAESVVNDYCNGILGCDMNDNKPGLFFVPGEHNLVSLRQNYLPLLYKARDKQKSWFTVLVKMADALWSRTNGNPLSIGDDMRLAAHELNIEDKPWLKDFFTSRLIPCIACGNLNRETVVVCPNCKVVLDKEKFKELGLGFAQ